MRGWVRRLVTVGTLLVAGAGCSCSDEGRDERAGRVESEDPKAEPRARAADEAAAPAGAASEAVVPKPRHALNGTVRTFDGRALPGAVIRAEPVPVFPHAPEPRSASEVTADAAGAFALTSLEAGDWSLLVSAEGALGTCAATVRVPECERADVVLPRGSVIEGLVIDETTRAPVGGARVRLRGTSRRWIGDTRTAADGRFTLALFDEPRQGDWRIDDDGYARELAESSNTSVAFEALGRHEVTLVAQRGRTLGGRVVGPEGPIVGARVTVESAGDDEPEDHRVATTDASGRYEVEHLGPWADFFVVAEAAGFVQQGERDPDVAAAGPPTGDLVDVTKTGWTAPDIRMRKRVPIGRCTIVGVVVDEDERPVAGVDLVTHHKIGAVRARSEADGSFALADVPVEARDEQVRIGCVADGDWEGDVSVDTTAGASVRDVRLYVGRIEHQHVRGRVLGPDRTPVAGARVIGVVGDVLTTHCFAPADASFVHGFDSHTRADGTFDVELRYRGQDFTLIVEGARFALWIREIPLSEAIEKPVEVVLEPPVAFSGRAVRRGTDIGIAGLSISLVRGASSLFTDSGETFPERRVVATTAVDGSFCVAGLCAVDMLDIDGPGWIRSEVELADRSPSDPIRVEMQTALALTGRAQFADARPCAGVDVAVYEVDPDEFGTARESWKPGDSPGDRPLRAADDGTFACDQLVAGKYWLEISGGSPQVIRRVAGPFDAGTRDVVIELVRGATIRGRVVRPDGNPANGVTVKASADEPARPRGVATADRAGTFAVGGLDAGTYTITVEEDGYLTWTKSRVRAEGDALEIRLDEGLAVEGVVLSADGEVESQVNLVVEPLEAEKPAKTQRGRTNFYGRFRITALTKGRWRIRVDGDDPSHQLPEVVVEAGSESLELRLQPKPLAGEKKPDAPPADDGR